MVLDTVIVGNSDGFESLERGHLLVDYHVVIFFFLFFRVVVEGAYFLLGRILYLRGLTIGLECFFNKLLVLE